MFTSSIGYLKRPELVVEFQEFFGVEYTKDDNNISQIENDESIKTCPEEVQQPLQNEMTESPQNIKKELPYKIHNKFWYYLFLFGTELGDEIFYATFIPFWFWNVDSVVARKVILLWSIVMYIGQSLKDIIRWPRPGWPACQLQEKWSLEYGMPSTHAMVAVSIPFSLLFFTHQRYLIPAYVGLIISILWCTVVCLSRIYLGMHSVLDVIAGVLLTFGLMVILVPLIHFADIYIVTSIYSPIFLISTSFLMIYFYPQSKEKWTPTRKDTTMTISVSVGLQIGIWINYQLIDLQRTSSLELQPLIFPTLEALSHLLARTVFGVFCILATRSIVKPIAFAVTCAILGKDKNEVRNSPSGYQNKVKTFIELSQTYFTYGFIGFNITYLLPKVFNLIGIGRPEFYTEI